MSPGKKSFLTGIVVPKTILNAFSLQTNHLIGSVIFNRPGVSGAVLQTPPALIHQLLHRATHPFPPNL